MPAELVFIYAHRSWQAPSGIACFAPLHRPLLLDRLYVSSVGYHPPSQGASPPRQVSVWALAALVGLPASSQCKPLGGLSDMDTAPYRGLRISTFVSCWAVRKCRLLELNPSEGFSLRIGRWASWQAPGLCPAALETRHHLDTRCF